MTEIIKLFAGANLLLINHILTLMAGGHFTNRIRKTQTR